MYTFVLAQLTCLWSQIAGLKRSQVLKYIVHVHIFGLTWHAVGSADDTVAYNVVTSPVSRTCLQKDFLAGCMRRERGWVFQPAEALLCL